MMRQGHFGMNRQDSYHGGNAPATAEELQDIRRWLLIDAALSEVRRAFTFSIGPEWHTSELAVPRLNRRPLMPGYLTWGRALHYGGGNSAYSGPHDWMAGGRRTLLRFDNRRQLVLGDANDPDFMRQLHDLLAASEAAIDARLRADPRWAVFLVSRQGRHEWIPAGSRSTSGQLAAEWTGSWTLQKTFYDFTPEPSAPAHAPHWATISRDGDRSWIDYATAAGRYRCELRYSGGSTYRLQDGQHGSSATDTALGYLPAVSRNFHAGGPGPVDALAPLDPRKRYRQVLVLCPEGEAEDNRSVRFLLLAGDTLLEIHRDAAHGPLVQMRHYTRGGPLVEPAAFTETDPRAYLARLDQLARKAEAARDAIETASVAELIASLHSSRNESLYYNSDGWPSNVKALSQRPGTVPALVAALGTETDGLVRFNLAMLLAHKLSTGKLAPEDAIVAGDGLALALADAHPWVRTEAVWGLRFTRARRYIEPARALLADPDAQVRAEASGTVRALSRDDAPAGNR